MNDGSSGHRQEAFVPVPHAGAVPSIGWVQERNKIIKITPSEYLASEEKLYSDYHSKFHKFTYADDRDYTKELLTEKDIFSYMDGAYRGSGVAALMLANFYKNKRILPDGTQFLLGVCTNPHRFRYKHEDESALYWYRIGAQNGNADCMKEYARLLLSSNHEYDKIRGKFWLDRAEKKAISILNFSFP